MTIPLSSSKRLANDLDGKNAECECFCSQEHGHDVPRFWIQCDNCQTWFHSTSRCLTFAEAEAPYIGAWICWGCRDDLRSHNQEQSKNQPHECTDEKRSIVAFEVLPGDTVKVEEHAWPGVNNPEGFAKILKHYVNEDGDSVNDIKYIVGGRRKGVLSQFLKPHSFT